MNASIIDSHVTDFDRDVADETPENTPECCSINCHRTTVDRVVLAFDDGEHRVKLSCCKRCRSIFERLDWIDVESDVDIDVDVDADPE